MYIYVYINIFMYNGDAAMTKAILSRCDQCEISILPSTTTCPDRNCCMPHRRRWKESLKGGRGRALGIASLFPKQWELLRFHSVLHDLCPSCRFLSFQSYSSCITNSHVNWSGFAALYFFVLYASNQRHLLYCCYAVTPHFQLSFELSKYLSQNVNFFRVVLSFLRYSYRFFT